MHRARRQCHSRTSTYNSNDLLFNTGSFSSSRVQFHLLSIIHLSFSRCQMLTLVYFFKFVDFLPTALSSSLCHFTFVYPFLLPPSTPFLKSKDLHSVTSLCACKIVPKNAWDRRPICSATGCAPKKE